jgi:hypothetical protein
MTITPEQIVAERIGVDAGDKATTTESQVASEDYKALYEQQKAQTESLQAVIDATRIGKTSSLPSDKGTKPSMTAERFKRMVDPVEFIRMTRDNKLRGIGVDPASVTDEALRALFGKGADGKLSCDLFKSNSTRYYLLKQAALVLNIYGG